MWKTLNLDVNGNPIFAPISIDLIISLTDAISDNESALFEAAEMHRIALSQSTDPRQYDTTTGWD